MQSVYINSFPRLCAMLSTSTFVTTVRDHLKQLLFSSCGVACINSPSATVVSGTAEDFAQFRADVTAQDTKVHARTLSVPFAFNSFQMDPILQDYISLAGGVTNSAPKIPVASMLLRAIVNGLGIFNQGYLAQQTRQTVDFVGGLNAVKSKLNDPVWLEIGPGTVCTSFVRATLSPAPAKTMYTIEANSSNWTSISKSLSVAYMNGVDMPVPDVRITLLQGRPGPGKTPFYLMADGTGSIATYTHLPSFKSKIPVYGVDLPFLCCPSRLTT